MKPTSDDADRALRSNALLGGTDEVRRETKNGREYLVTPVVAAREMVLDYPEIDGGRKELLPAESFQATADLWSGEPVVAQHPRENTAKSADVYTEQAFGHVHEPEADDEKLRFNEVWFDVEKAESIGGPAAEVVDRLERGESIAVSPGYQPTEIEHDPGHYDGQQYDAVQGPIVPDHLAAFPPDEFRARCDLEDGCGAPRLNAVADPELSAMLDSGVDDHTMANDDEPLHPSTVQRVLSMFDWSSDAPRVNAPAEHDHDDCGCGGECDDCASESDDGSGDDPSDEDGEASSDDDTSNDDNTDDTMSDHDIETLAAQSSFTVEQLQSFGDDELDALEETVTTDLDATGTDDGTGDVEADTDADAPDVDADGADTAAARQNTEPPEWAQQLQSEVEDLSETVDEMRENAATEEYEEEIRLVTNHVDGMDEDDARELATDNPTALEALASEHRGPERVNMAGVPGPTDRDPDPSADTSDIPAGTRSDYDSRTSGGDN